MLYLTLYAARAACGRAVVLDHAAAEAVCHATGNAPSLLHTSDHTLGVEVDAERPHILAALPPGNE